MEKMIQMVAEHNQDSIIKNFIFSFISEAVALVNKGGE